MLAPWDGDGVAGALLVDFAAAKVEDDASWGELEVVDVEGYEFGAGP